MSPERPADPLVILIAPNLSQRMGGEGIMALQIYEGLAASGVPVHQITHDRVREELARRHPEMRVSFVRDTAFQKWVCRVPVLKWLVQPIFAYEAARVARRLIREHPGSVVHYTSPVSPVAPQARIDGAPVIIGPLNGNIHHPPAFRGRESWEDWVRRRFTPAVQLLLRPFSPGKRTAEVVLVAGGERTRESLRIAGCREEQFRDSLTCGIPDRLRDDPPVEHRGRNLRFVQNGRLVPHKGTDLVIKAMARTRNPVELDVIGRGPSKPGLERLTAELGLQDRVHFIEWFENHDDLAATLRGARAFLFPSLAEAHGIVVQEAMMMGLPVIGVDWGGPSLMVTPESGILVPPTGEDDVVRGLAEAMDRLAEDGELADRMGKAGREIALERGFAWSDLLQQWIAIYRECGLRTETGAPAALSSKPLV